jgi:hypothetical protein
MTTSRPDRPVPRVDPFAEPYWQALRRHEFVLPRSRATGRWFLPVRAVAPPEFDWVPAPRTGAIVSFSVVHVPPSDDDWPLPHVLATVALDDGPQMMCNIVDGDPDDVAVGRRVHLVFEDRRDGWVVPQFALDQDGGGRPATDTHHGGQA